MIKSYIIQNANSMFVLWPCHHTYNSLRERSINTGHPALGLPRGRQLQCNIVSNVLSSLADQISFASRSPAYIIRTREEIWGLKSRGGCNRYCFIIYKTVMAWISKWYKMISGCYADKWGYIIVVTLCCCKILLSNTAYFQRPISKYANRQSYLARLIQTVEYRCVEIWSLNYVYVTC